MEMDIFDVETSAENGAFVQFTDKHGDLIFDKDKKKVGVSVKGSDCDEYKRFERNRTKDTLAKAGKNKSIDLEEYEKKQIRALAKMTTGWHGISGEDGNPLKCNFENAIKVYTKYTMIFEQVSIFVNDRSNF